MYKVNLDNIGLESANKAYGGYLDAHSFEDISFNEWYNNFRELVISKIGKEFFPVYRMADGEYKFLMGRKLNLHKKPLWKEILGFLAEKTRIKNPDKWKTSWGEQYDPEKVKGLRKQLIEDIRFISNNGMLACYYNRNGLRAFEEYNKYLLDFFKKNRISFSNKNYIPFHFVCGILVKDNWEEFYKNRKILIVTGSDDKSEALIKKTLNKFNPKDVFFLRISKKSSMEEKINISKFKKQNIDLILVAAGIGSANILRQLKPLKTVALDIGGYMNCFKDLKSSQHGGIFKLPS